MAVRIVHDFWDNYHNYEDLIKRCFYCLLQRFPYPDNEKEAYNQLLSRLFDLNIFSKFNPKQLAARKLGINKKWASAVITRKEASAESLKKFGINVESKFEQFVFKWIEHCLSEAYDQRRKQAHRYLPSYELAEQPPRDSTELRDRLCENQWAQSEEELAVLERHTAKRQTSNSRRTYPTYSDAGDFVGSKMGNALDEVEGEEIADKFTAVLKPSERRILDLLQAGCKPVEIAGACECSPQNVSVLMTEIRRKYNRFMKLSERA